MTQLELDLEAPSAPSVSSVPTTERQASVLAVVLPFRRPGPCLNDAKLRENEARVIADLESVRLFM